MGLQKIPLTSNGYSHDLGKLLVVLYRYQGCIQEYEIHIDSNVLSHELMVDFNFFGQIIGTHNFRGSIHIIPDESNSHLECSSVIVLKDFSAGHNIPLQNTYLCLRIRLFH